MSKQWGHGFYKGVEAAISNSKTLAGLYFHSRKDGKFEWQGQVMRDLENGSYVVQLFEWGQGEPSVQKIIPFEQMKEWDFYPTGIAMRYEWNKQTGGTEEDFDFMERCREARNRM